MGKVRQRLADLREALSVGTMLCIGAFLLSACAGWLLNGSVYAHVAEYCGIAREVSTLFSAGLFLVLFFVASRKPEALDRRIMAVVSLGSLITALLVLSFALKLEDGPSTVLGFLFLNIGSVWAASLLALALASLPSPLAMTLAVVCGMPLGEVAVALLPMPSFEVGLIAITACDALMIALLYRGSAPALDRLTGSASAADLELANPESFLRPTHALFVCAFVFSVATGYELTLNEVAHAPVSSDLVSVVLVGVALWMLLGSQNDGKEDTLFSFSVLLVIAGFLVAPFTFDSGLPSANALQRIGVDSFKMLTLLVVLSVGRRNVFALLPTFTLVRCMMALGTDVGAVAGHTSNDLASANAQAAALIAAISLFAFIAFLWSGFRKFSFADTIRGVANVNADAGASEARDSFADSDAGASAGASIEERCAQLGAEGGLTERETEIFAMLARGRNGQYVMDHYVISRNTVKSHVKHIYAKLGVHSQQELIDLVERYE